MVDTLGGIDSVLSSQSKIEQVVKHLDHGQQITIAVLQNQASINMHPQSVAKPLRRREGGRCLGNHCAVTDVI